MKNINQITAARLIVEIFGDHKRAGAVVKAAESIVASDDNLRLKFAVQRRTAAQRNIKFQLTYEQWLQIWMDSGHLPQRGKGEGMYVMSRHGDKGPYAVGNVSIILHAENVRDGRLGKKFPRQGR